MSKFKVDSEQIDATVETLKTLLTKCEELYEKEVPVSDVDKGQTHEELISVCDNIRTTCYYFGQLIHNTIEFLGKSSEMFAQSEMNSANAIKEDGGSTTHVGSSGATHGGSGQTLSQDSAQETYPSLQHSMDVPMNQYDPQYASVFTQPYGYNAGCCATIYATGMSIVNGRSYTPTDYWYNGTTNYEPNTLSEYSHGFDANVVYKSLMAGKPTMCHYGHNLYDGGQHWVLITGVNDGADISNLTYMDFKAIDPATGTERNFSELVNAYPGLNLWGHQQFL